MDKLKYPHLYLFYSSLRQFCTRLNKENNITDYYDLGGICDLNSALRYIFFQKNINFLCKKIFEYIFEDMLQLIVDEINLELNTTYNKSFILEEIKRSKIYDLNLNQNIAYQVIKNMELRYFSVHDELRLLLQDPIDRLLIWCETRLGQRFYNRLSSKIKSKLTAIFYE